MYVCMHVMLMCSYTVQVCVSINHPYFGCVCIHVCIYVLYVRKYVCKYSMSRSKYMYVCMYVCMHSYTIFVCMCKYLLP